MGNGRSLLLVLLLLLLLVLLLLLLVLVLLEWGARCGEPKARQKEEEEEIRVINAPSSSSGARQSAGDKYSMFHSLSKVGMSGLC